MVLILVMGVIVFLWVFVGIKFCYSWLNEFFYFFNFLIVFNFMNIFGIGLFELGLIFVIVLLVFGFKKLLEVGCSLGKVLWGF